MWIKILEYVRVLCQNMVVLRTESWILPHSPSLSSFHTSLCLIAQAAFWTYVWIPRPMCPRSIHTPHKQLSLVYCLGLGIHTPETWPTLQRMDWEGSPGRAWEQTRSYLGRGFGSSVYLEHGLEGCGVDTGCRKACPISPMDSLSHEKDNSQRRARIESSEM